MFRLGFKVYFTLFSLTFFGDAAEARITGVDLDGSSSLKANRCSPSFYTASVTRSGQRSPTTLLLSSPSSTMKFYADASCSKAVTSLSIAANQNSKRFYIKDGAAESTSIQAKASGSRVNPARLNVAVTSASTPTPTPTATPSPSPSPSPSASPAGSTNSAGTTGIGNLIGVKSIHNGDSKRFMQAIVNLADFNFERKLDRGADLILNLNAGANFAVVLTEYENSSRK